jgi:iron only hydrogenase large subunit-like protein
MATCLIHGGSSLSPPTRPFGKQKTRHSSAVVDAPPTAAPPKKTEKITPEAQELTQVLMERNENKSPFKYIVAQTAPSVRIAFSEVFGKEPGAFKADVLVASLKALGFDLVLDTNTAADLTICEEGQELLERILASEEAKETGETPTKPLPLFTSCCPGWMKLVQKSAPELSPFISTCKSPHMSKSLQCRFIHSRLPQHVMLKAKPCFCTSVRSRIEKV